MSAPAPTFSHDKAASCYRYTAPAGYRFGGDLHEFTYHYGYDERPTRQTQIAAVRDFKDRMGTDPLAPCQDADCDWCNSYIGLRRGDLPR